MACIYAEIKSELKFVADIFEENGIEYKAYNSGVQYNTSDKNGVIHSFYPTTGTMLFHQGNDRRSKATRSVRGGNVFDFIDYLTNVEKIQHLF